MEAQFATQSDPLFRYYLYTAGLISISMIVIKTIIPNMPLPRKVTWTFILTVAIIIISLMFTLKVKQKMR